MFKKLHLQLTSMCAVITICILFLFTGLYLYISEKMLVENHVLSFQYNTDSLYTNMEQQSVITLQYLLQMEQNNQYLLFLWDNDTPLYFNSLNHHLPLYHLAEKAMAEYNSVLSSKTDSAESSLDRQKFVMEDENGSLYDISVAHIQTGQLSAAQNLMAKAQRSGLSVVVLSSRNTFNSQLEIQRMWFLVLAAAGCVLLIVFAWWFTGRLLGPIRDNQHRQIQFVSDASHELRTPLAVIRSCISIRPPNYEETIKSECDHMGGLIEDMLNLTGLESRTRTIKKESVEPDTFLLNLYEEMEPLAREKGLLLTVDLPDKTLPRFTADPVRFKQLFMILLQNAISYTPAGGSTTLSVSSTHKDICFRVIDTGIGIPDKDKKYIFERFYRADTSHSGKEHFGLGLCIAKEIVLMHHGQIFVEDTPGGGSTFTCVFPHHS